MKRFLGLAIIISFLLLPNISSAITCNGVESNLNLCYPTVTIPGLGEIDLNTLAASDEGIPLNTLIAWFYYFIIGIAGISAFVMLVWGGVEWLTSAGNPSRITSAKDRMTSALLGLLIILTSWLILQVINPDLTTLILPTLD